MLTLTLAQSPQVDGKFFKGDSYILLSTEQVSESPKTIS